MAKQTSTAFALTITILVSSVSAPAGLAADLAWTGVMSSDWNDSANWYPQQVPTNDDHVFISSGNVAIPASATFAVIDWGGGTISGVLTIASNAVLNIVGTDPKNLQGAITNEGQVNLLGAGDLNADCGALWENRPGGIFSIHDRQLLNGGCDAEFRNAGLLRKTTDTGYSWVRIALHNTGIVEAQKGHLMLDGGGRMEGTNQASAGARILFSRGPHTFSPAYVSTGDGFVGVADFRCELYGTLNTRLGWSGGPIGGGLTIASNGVLNITGNVTKTLQGAITNEGLVNFGGFSPLIPECGAVLVNRPGGVFDIKSDVSFVHNPACDTPFHNAGLLRKSGGTGESWLGLVNSGTVHVQTGLLQLFSYGGPTPPTGRLLVSIRGPTDYGRFIIRMGLSGTFGIVPENGFVPTPGDRFQIISVYAPPGDFTNFEGLDYENGIRLVPQFSDQGVNLLAVDEPVVSQPRLRIFPTWESVFVYWPIEFTGYRLLSAPNLATTHAMAVEQLDLSNWSDHPQTGTNRTMVSRNEAHRYFLLIKP